MSLLRRIRHLNDIPGLVDHELGGEEWWAEETAKTKRIAKDRFARRTKAWERTAAHTPRELETYLNGSQHDAWILGHARDGDRFTLTASDENTTMLAEWGFGLSWSDCHFPFDLLFEGVSYIGWRGIDKRGGLKWIAPPSVPKEGQFSWLMDTLIEPESPGIRWVLMHTAGKPYNGLLLVEARSMRVVERQRAAWERLVGPESLDVFDRCQAERNERPLTDLAQRDVYLKDFGAPMRGETR